MLHSEIVSCVQKLPHFKSPQTRLRRAKNAITQTLRHYASPDRCLRLNAQSSYAHEGVNMWNLTEKIAQNLRKPSFGFYGSLIRRLLLANYDLEITAVKLLEVKPHHTVLEVGFGPGYGLKYALDSGLRQGSGKLYGLDFSEAVCQHATKKFHKDIASGKLEIRNEDVAKQSFPDGAFDKVFHTQSHLYWPDLPAACEELFRVLKSGGDMVTVMSLGRLLPRKDASILKYATNTAPDAYLQALQDAGFKVELQTVPMGRWKYDLTGIMCKKPTDSQ